LGRFLPAFLNPANAYAAVMNHPTPAASAAKCLCLIALPCLISFDAHCESSIGETQPRLARTHLLLYHDKKVAVHPVKSVRDWSRRRAEIVRSMEAVMGPLPGKDKRGPLDPKIEEEVDCGEYVRRLLTYAAEPGSRVPAYLLVPKSVLEG